jgi:hypothetical protein
MRCETGRNARFVRPRAANLSGFEHGSISAEHKCAWRKVRQILEFVLKSRQAAARQNPGLPLIRARCAQIISRAQHPAILGCKRGKNFKIAILRAARF